MSKFCLNFLSITVFVLLSCFFFGFVSCQKSTPRFQCHDSLGCVQVEPNVDVKIGVLQALSGKVEALGREQVRGIELAIDERQGVFLGHPIALQIENTGCTPEGGANAALKIIADPQTVAIIGTTCSAAGATASKAMSDAGLTMVSGNNSAPFLTSIGGKKGPHWQPGYFRTASNEETSGKTAALFAFKHLGIRRAAYINDGDIYTTGLTDGFGQTFEALGGQIVLGTSINKGDHEMLPVLTAVINAKTELLFFPLFQPEGNMLLIQARQTDGFEKIILMGGGALIESSFIEDVQSAAVGMYFIGPARPSGPSVDHLTDRYRAKYNTQPAASYFLNAYDATEILLAALQKSVAKDPDGTLHVGRQALRDALYATRNFPGLTNHLNCDEFGDCGYPVFNVLRLEDPQAGVDGLQSNILFTYSPEE